MASCWFKIICTVLLFAFVNGSVVKKKSGETRAKQIENERDAYSRLMASYMDTAVDPCDDFYEYSCGNYFKAHKVKYGVSSTDIFGIVADEMNKALHEILMQPPNSDKTMVTDKAKLFYQSCMRVNIFEYPKSEAYVKLIESLGGWPALDSQWSSEKFDWLNVTIELNSLGVDAFFTVFEVFDMIIPNEVPVGIHMFLVDRKFTREYTINRELIMKILTMYGVSSRKAKKIFREIVQLGKEWTKFTTNFNKNEEEDNLKTIEIIKEEVPEVDWDRYFLALFGKEFNSSTTVYAKSEFLKKFPKFFTKKNAKTVANYMFLQMLYGLHTEFRQPKYHKEFCAERLKAVMPHVVTLMYLDSEHHQQSVEDEVMSMASYMRGAFKDIVKNIDWMDMETKRKALVKLRDMRMVIGDVELSLDLKTLDNEYQDVHLAPENDFYENNLVLTRHSIHQKLKISTEPSPYRYKSDVNAYYDPSENKLILPAGILRRPFYIPGLPAAYNYAAMGANIIGHEMTHGFDSMGRHYDQDGNEVDWWSPEADAGFDERAKCFVEQYDAYRIPEMNVNIRGNLTLPENIADSGGVRQGYIAYQKWLKAHDGMIDMSRETLPYLNMTNYQLFFLSYAQSYCSQYKREMYQLLEGDVHAANKFRVIGSVANFDEFGKEFNCKLGTTMNPARKCVLW